jgi:hypothetical protein
MPSLSLQPIASILQAILQRHGLAPKILDFQLQQRWAQIAGEQIACHSQPDHIRFRKLYLLVDNSIWLQQLMFLKPTLIEKINAIAGQQSIVDIVLRVGELKDKERGVAEEAGSASQQRVSPSPPVDQARSHPANDDLDRTGAIKDPDLREKLAALMTAALSRPACDVGLQPDPQPSLKTLPAEAPRSSRAL